MSNNIDNNIYYKLLLDSLTSTDTYIILWKKENNTLITIYNNLNILLHTTLTDYINNNNIPYKQLYDNILINNREQDIKDKNYNITVKKLQDNIYVETRIKCNNNNYDNSTFLLYTVSAKLKEPIDNIVSVLSIINYDFNPSKNADDKESLEIIRDSSYNIISTANDLIDIINLENCKIKLEYSLVYLTNIITNIYKIVSEKIKKKKLNFNYKISDKTPLSINCDIERLSQLLVNLIDNSINACQEGFGTIIIEISVYDESVHKDTNCPFIFNKNKNSLLFKIKDTGCGIDSNSTDIVNNILTISNKKITTYKNYGFGLTICKNLANLMGGNIWYKTDTDIGTVFYTNIEYM